MPAPSGECLTLEGSHELLVLGPVIPAAFHSGPREMPAGIEGWLPEIVLTGLCVSRTHKQGCPVSMLQARQLLSGPVPFLLFSEEEQSAPTAASVLTPF